MGYPIIFSPEAEAHLKAFAARDRQLIFRQTMLHLSHQPARPTKRRKLMSPNPFAEWELRLGDFRVYYSVEEGNDPKVYVIAVGRKAHNRVFVAGEELSLEDH